MTGFHLWAVVLPQVIEGSLTVLVLYRAVRRLHGPLAGIVAALCLATSPVTVLLNRGNISDSLLILLLVLAADAASQAIATGRPRSLLLAGLYVGLAFQTKMLEAWVLLPAMALTYLLFVPAALRARWSAVGRFALVAVLVSLSWMTVVSVIPHMTAPSSNASESNSVFEQVFYYNGLDFADVHLPGSALGRPAPFLAERRAPSSSPQGSAGSGTGC